MRTVLGFMGTLILAGNVLLGEPIRVMPEHFRTAEMSEQEIRRELAVSLQARGIDAEASSHLVTEHVASGGPDFVPELMRFTLFFPEIDRQSVIEDMADHALMRRPVHLTEYDHVIARLHDYKGWKLESHDFRRAAEYVLMNRTFSKSS